jgi:uncharacterized protein
MKEAQDKKLLFRSAGGNRYILSRSKPQVLLLHPILYYLIELCEKGADLEDWMMNHGEGDGNGVTIGENIRASKREVEYYYRFYLFLRDNQYFRDIKKINMGSDRFSPEIIKKQLANTQQITFEVTDRCNLRCRYCGFGELYSGYDRRGHKDLGIKIAKKLFDYVFELMESSLNTRILKRVPVSFYGGEPLLNMPFIAEMVRYARNKKPLHNEFYFSMTTNGLLLDRYMDFLVNHNFQLLISLDGNEIHNVYRRFPDGTPSYRVVFQNIRALMNRYPDYFDRSVNFNSVLHNKNSQEEVVEYFQKNFNKEPLIAEMTWVDLHPKKNTEFREIYRRSRMPGTKGLKSFLHTHTGFFFDKYDKLLYPRENSISVSTGTCDPFWKKIFVTVDGKVMPCERIGQGHTSGIVDEDHVEIDFKKTADKYNSLYRKMSRICNHCYGSDRCLKCIFTSPALVEAEKPRCDEFMNYKNFKKHLSQSISIMEQDPRLYSSLMKDTQAG